MTATLPKTAASFPAPAPSKDDQLAITGGPKFIPKYALDQFTSSSSILAVQQMKDKYPNAFYIAEILYTEIYVSNNRTPSKQDNLLVPGPIEDIRGESQGFAY